MAQFICRDCVREFGADMVKASLHSWSFNHVIVTKGLVEGLRQGDG